MELFQRIDSEILQVADPILLDGGERRQQIPAEPHTEWNTHASQHRIRRLPA